MSTSPLHKYIRQEYGEDVLTTSEVAEKVGRSVIQIRRYRTSGGFVPKRQEVIGGITVPLYTKGEVDELKEFIKQQKPGPKPKAEKA